MQVEIVLVAVLVDVFVLSVLEPRIVFGELGDVVLAGRAAQCAQGQNERNRMIHFEEIMVGDCVETRSI